MFRLESAGKTVAPDVKVGLKDWLDDCDDNILSILTKIIIRLLKYHKFNLYFKQKYLQFKEEFVELEFGGCIILYNLIALGVDEILVWLEPTLLIVKPVTFGNLFSFRSIL